MESANEFPNLESLELWLGENDPIALLRHPLPRLQTLGLCNYTGTDPLCRRLPTMPLLAQLRSLSLTGGTMSDAGVAALIDNATAFAHLDVLDLADNYITSDAFARLVSALPNARGEEQRVADDERYVAVTE